MKGVLCGVDGAIYLTEGVVVHVFNWVVYRVIQYL